MNLADCSYSVVKYLTDELRKFQKFNIEKFTLFYFCWFKNSKFPSNEFINESGGNYICQVLKKWDVIGFSEIRRNENVYRHRDISSTIHPAYRKIPVTLPELELLYIKG